MNQANINQIFLKNDNIMNESSKDLTLQQKQRIQIQMLNQYNKAIVLLKQNKKQQGKKLLIKILQSNLINQNQLKKLKRSVLLSLANLHANYHGAFLNNSKINQKSQNVNKENQIQDSLKIALVYYFQAVQLQRQFKLQQKQLSQLLLLDKNKNNSAQYVLLMKIYQISEKLNLSKLSIYILKRCIHVCPDLWRQKCIKMLQLKYQSLNLNLQLNDIRRLKQNPNLIKKIIQQENIKTLKSKFVQKNNQTGQLNNCLQNEQFLDEYNKLNDQKTILKSLKIYLQNQQKYEQLLSINSSYSLLQYVLQICYILLKCQNKRNFNKKRYLHKKYQVTNQKWHNFLQQYDLIKTSIEIIYLKPIESQQKNIQNQQIQNKTILKQNENKIQEQIICQNGINIKNDNKNEEDKKQNQPIEQINQEQKMIKQLATQLLRIKYNKKKKNKNIQLQQKQNNQSNQFTQEADEALQDNIYATYFPAKNTNSLTHKNSSQNQSNQKQLIYISLRNYFIQNLQRNEVNIQELKQLLNSISQNNYNLYFKDILSDEQNNKQKQQDEQDQKDLQLSSINDLKNNNANMQKQILANNQNKQTENINNTQQQNKSKKLNFKDKKKLQKNKIKFLNSLFQNIILNQTQNKYNLKVNRQNYFNENKKYQKFTINFNNVYKLFNILLGQIFKLQIQSQLNFKNKITKTNQQENQNLQNVDKFEIKRFQLEQNQSIKELLGKIILKIQDVNSSLFKIYENSRLSSQNKQNKLQKIFFLSILVNHFDHMSIKKVKNTQFTIHQNQKILKLKQYIDQKFQIGQSLYALQQQLSIEQICIFIKWSKIMIQFYLVQNNFNIDSIEYYRKICLFYHQKLHKIIQNYQNNQNSNIKNFAQQIYLQSTQEKIFWLIQQKKKKFISIQQQKSEGLSIKILPQIIEYNKHIHIQKQQIVLNKNINIQLIIKTLQTPNSLQIQDNIFQRIKLYIQKYFNCIQQEINRKEQLNVKFIDILTTKMKLGVLFKKLCEGLRVLNFTKIYEFHTSINLKWSLITLLIKFIIFSSLDKYDDCLRIIFYMTNTLIKNIDCQQKQTPYLVQKISIMYRSLINYNKNKGKLQNQLLIFKKYYENILSKTLVSKTYKDHIKIWKSNFSYKNKWKDLLVQWFQIKNFGYGQKNNTNGNKKLQKNQHFNIFNYQVLKQLKQLNQKFISQKNQKKMIQQNDESNKNILQISQIQKSLISIVPFQLYQKLFYIDNILQITNNIYYYTDFQPKKIQDALLFFVFLSRNYSQQFECQQLQLSPDVIKVFKKCYKIFQQKKNQYFKFCERFIQFKKKISLMWDGVQKENNDIISIMKGHKQICQCCKVQKLNEYFNYMQISFVLAKFFQTHPYEQQIIQEQLQNIQLDQQYYKQYLLLSGNKNVQSWINYIRINSLKAYYYFDSMIGDSIKGLQIYKNKFLFTKRVINFVKLHIFSNQNKQIESSNNQKQQKQQIVLNTQKLKDFITRTLNILNILKLKQRQFLMTLKNIQSYSLLNLNPISFNKQLYYKDNIISIKQKKQAKDLIKKYYEGIKVIEQKYDHRNDLTSIYLQIVQLKLVLINKQINDLITENITKQNQQFIKLTKIQEINNLFIKLKQDIKNTIINFQLYQNDKTRNIQNLNELANHLQEDLIVQFYTVLTRLFQFIINQIVKNKLNRINNVQFQGNIQNHNIINNQKYNKYKQIISYWIDSNNQLAKNNKYLLIFKQQQTLNNLISVNNQKLISIQNVNDNISLLIEQRIKKNIQQKMINQNQQNQQKSLINLQNSEDQMLQQDKRKKFNFEPLQQYKNNQNGNSDQMNQKNVEEQDQKMNNKLKYSNLDKSNINNINKQKKKDNIINRLNISQFIKRQIKQKFGVNDLNRLEQNKQILLDFTDLQNQIIQQLNTFLNSLSQLIKTLTKYQQKRFKYRRSIIKGLVYVSELQLKYSSQNSSCLQTIKQYYNIRSDDIVFVYSHCDRKSTQKILRLSQFYNRTLVVNLLKIKFIQHIIECFYRNQMIQNLVILIRKLNKIMQIDGQNNIVQDNNKNQQQINQKATNTQILNTKNINRQVRHYVSLYCLAVDSYLKLVQKMSIQQPLQQRYEKMLVEFKNRIKRTIQLRVQISYITVILSSNSSNTTNNNGLVTLNLQQVQELKGNKQKALHQNYYYQSIDKFIKQYQKKYQRKVKLKKSKKQRQIEKQKQLEKQKQKQKNKIKALQPIINLNIDPNTHLNTNPNLNVDNNVIILQNQLEQSNNNIRQTQNSINQQQNYFSRKKSIINNISQLPSIIEQNIEQIQDISNKHVQINQIDKQIQKQLIQSQKISEQKIKKQLKTNQGKKQTKMKKKVQKNINKQIIDLDNSNQIISMNVNKQQSINKNRIPSQMNKQQKQKQQEQIQIIQNPKKIIKLLQYHQIQSKIIFQQQNKQKQQNLLININETMNNKNMYLNVDANLKINEKQKKQINNESNNSCEIIQENQFEQNIKENNQSNQE